MSTLSYIQLAMGDYTLPYTWTNMLTTYGLFVTDKDIYKFPERSYTQIEIPGANGSYIVDDGYYKNVDIWYEFGYAGLNSVSSEMNLLAAFFAGANYSGKYFRITDSYNPLVYRYGILNGGLSMIQGLEKTGKMRLELSCKPYRYYASGDTSTFLTSTPVSFVNPSGEASMPLLMISVSSDDTTVTIHIGSNSYTIHAEYAESLMLDCEKKILYNFYDGTVRNDWYTSSDFPTIPVGTTSISLDGAESESWVMPRWFTL